jgi:hypothetical protein
MYQVDNVISCFDYYRQAQARDLAHKAKIGDNDSLLKMAKQMSLWMPDDSVLIPSPSRTGVATDTLIIANEISRLRKVRVLDVVTGNERRSLYDMKKEGGEIPDGFFNYRLKSSEIKSCDTVYIIDTVFDTGRTTGELLKLIPNAKVLTHSRVGLFDNNVIRLQKGGLVRKIEGDPCCALGL